MLRASLIAFLLFGCSTLRDDLQRAETGYEAARYERAQVWLRAIEDEVPQLTPRDRARYYYLRGMTALRLEDRDEALHFLSLAREEADEGGTLPERWSETLAPTLESLTPTTATHTARAPQTDP
ncbi:MAG: hypothetical protein AAF645_17395 [Myxococcota bacterium]